MTEISTRSEIADTAEKVRIETLPEDLSAVLALLSAVEAATEARRKRNEVWASPPSPVDAFYDAIDAAAERARASLRVPRDPAPTMTYAERVSRNSAAESRVAHAEVALPHELGRGVGDVVEALSGLWRVSHDPRVLEVGVLIREALAGLSEAASARQVRVADAAPRDPIADEMLADGRTRIDTTERLLPPPVGGYLLTTMAHLAGAYEDSSESKVRAVVAAALSTVGDLAEELVRIQVEAAEPAQGAELPRKLRDLLDSDRTQWHVRYHGTALIMSRDDVPGNAYGAYFPSEQMAKLVFESLLLVRRLAARAPEQSPSSSAPDAPVAWAYELATWKSTDGTHGGWVSKVSSTKPNVPVGSIRGLTPLYGAGARTLALVAREMVPLEDAPTGLFRSPRGEVCVKVESDRGDVSAAATRPIEAYVAATGEAFWSGTSDPSAQRGLLVAPLDVVSDRSGAESAVALVSVSSLQRLARWVGAVDQAAIPDEVDVAMMVRAGDVREASRIVGGR